MLMFRRSLTISQNIFQLNKLVNYAKYRSNQRIHLTRFISNSGSLIAGCCFSRQSDEETLIPNNNDGTLDSQIVYNSQPRTSIVDNVTKLFRMKRSCDSHDDISSQHDRKNTDQLIETCSKKLKTDDNKDNTTKEEHSEILFTSPIGDNIALSKTESGKSEIKKPKATAEKPIKQRPNYFVAIKISDAQIIKALNELQQHMLEKDERLKKSMIQLATSHITLMVMYIKDSEMHARALETLENIHQEHNDDLSKNPLKLEFKGLSHFQNRVLYAKLSADDSFDRLSSLAVSVREHYTAASIFSTDSRTDFTPHLTVAKIREVRKKQKEFPKKINPSFYKDFNDQYFGTQEVQSIQLLSMTDPKDEDGYYSGNEIYFSAFEPKVRRDYLNKMLETEEKKKNVKDMINALMKEKLK